MVWWGKSNVKSAAPTDLGNDNSANELLDRVVEELVKGRSRSEVTNELVRHGWEKKAATEFCQLAGNIAREIRTSPEQRAACAQRGMERLQAALGWIASGIVIALIMRFGVLALRPYWLASLAVVGFGVVELISGFALWWPHKEFLDGQATSSTGRPPSKSKGI